jgi:hypothetical protein
MRSSRHSVSLATYALAFAAVLSPSFMQTGPTIGCSLDESGAGDTELTVLEFEAAGENLIAFDPLQREYSVSLPIECEEVTLRAHAHDAERAVHWAISQEEAILPMETGVLPLGGGEVTCAEWPEGYSVLRVWVSASGGGWDSYGIHVDRF